MPPPSVRRRRRRRTSSTCCLPTSRTSPTTRHGFWSSRIRTWRPRGATRPRWRCPRSTGPAQCTICWLRLAEHGVDMTRMESRPSRTGMWEYVFFVDLKGHQQDAPVARASRSCAAALLFSRSSVPIRPRYRRVLMIDACELSPSYVRAIAPYQPGKPISELAREMGLEESGIVKLASNENPLGVSPLARRAIEAQLEGSGSLPGRQRLRVEASAGRPLRSRAGPHRAGQRLQRRAGTRGSLFSRQRHFRGHVPARVRRLSSSDAGRRSSEARDAGQGLMATICRQWPMRCAKTRG